jgi:hypothetical protein
MTGNTLAADYSCEACNAGHFFQGSAVKPRLSYVAAAAAAPAAAAAAAGSNAVLAAAPAGEQPQLEYAATGSSIAGVEAAPAGEQPQDADAGSLSPELAGIFGDMCNSVMSDLMGFMPAAFKRAAGAAVGQLEQQVRPVAVWLLVLQVCLLHRFWLLQALLPVLRLHCAVCTVHSCAEH